MARKIKSEEDLVHSEKDNVCVDVQELNTIIIVWEMVILWSRALHEELRFPH